MSFHFPDPGQILHQIEDGAHHAADQAVGNVRHVADQAVGTIKHAGDQAVGTIKHEVTQGVDQLHHVRDAVQGEIVANVERVGRETAEKVEEAAVDAAQKALTIVASKGFKEGLETAKDIIEILAPDAFGLSLGFDIASVVDVGINLQVPNPVSKIGVIEKYIQNPPKGRSAIIDCVKEFGPSSLQINALSFGNGPDATWSGDSKYDKLDALLAQVRRQLGSRERPHTPSARPTPASGTAVSVDRARGRLSTRAPVAITRFEMLLPGRRNRASARSRREGGKDTP